jgi:dihydroorotase-like cyclic amidohydrolase
MVPLLFGEGRKRGLSYEKLSALAAGNAARIFGLPARAGIEAGRKADFFLYDLGAELIIDHASLHMKCDFSPYQGLRVTGWPVMTVWGDDVWETSS